MTFKDRGMILKEYAHSDYDKNIVLLLKDRGKVTVFAKGARKPKSKFFAGTQLFSYCEFVIFEGNGFLSLTQVEIVNNFFGISSDYDKFCYASYFFELVDKTIQPSMPAEDVLSFIARTLNVLTKDHINAHLVCSIFEFKYMQMEGYSPELHSCVDCGKTMDEPSNTDTTINYFFKPQGIVCNSCLSSKKNIMTIDLRVRYVMDYILNTDVKNIYQFNVSDEVVKGLRLTAGYFVVNNIDLVEIKTLKALPVL